MPKEGVSVIVCCYNSSLRIEKTLTHLANQHIGSLSCEIILVNNASSDNTAGVAQAVWMQSQNKTINFKIVEETKPGLSNARLKGIAESNYDYLIFCDDDNWLDENYISNTFRLFKENPTVAILGGGGIPEFEEPALKPTWFDKFYHGYAVGEQAEKEAFLNNVYGAGMAVKKQVLLDIFNKHSIFLNDRKGTHLSSGGDSEICFSVRLQGYQILYSPTLTFKHFITTKRLNWDYLKTLHKGFANSFVVLNLYELALSSSTLKLHPFYWLKKGSYYFGIYLKYWPKHYASYQKGQGTNEELLHITWKNIAYDYLSYNFKTVSMYRKIIAFKQAALTND